MADNADRPIAVGGEEDDDDDMADLFSFGSGEEAAQQGSGGTAAAQLSFDPSSPSVNVGTAAVGGTAAGAATPDEMIPQRDRAGSADSFLELLESEGADAVLLSAPHSPTTQAHNSSSATRIVDEETREILNWLENEGEPGGDAAAAAAEAAVPSEPLKASEASLDASAAAAGATPIALSPAPAPTVVALPPRFDTLEGALSSDESTAQQVRELARARPEELGRLSGRHRCQMYCRLLCGKTLRQVQESSLADSYAEFRGDPWPYPVDDLASRVLRVVGESKGGGSTGEKSFDSVVEDLQQLLGFYFSKQGNDEDVLIPPVAAAVLAVAAASTSSAPSQDGQQAEASGSSATASATATASVLLHQLVANSMPVLALRPSERWDAAVLLHQELYLLACYHVPLLVYHLDRHLPGWHWPQSPPSPGAILDLGAPQKQPGEGEDSGAASSSATKSAKGDLQSRGMMPLSWLLSHLAGECPSNGAATTAATSSPDGGSATLGLELDRLLKLWDQSLLVAEHPSAMRFFLVLAILEHASDELLLLTGEELRQSLQGALRLASPPENWWSRAQQLREWTPESVWVKLVSAEDRAVQGSLQRRQERAQRELQAKLDAEAEAHRIAQEQKAAAARERLTRARLVAFYRKHAPDKESNIDKIMETYAGDWETLDSKLRLKYGEGFNPPASKKPPPPPPSPGPAGSSSPFMSKKTNKLLSTMNTGLGVRRESDRSMQFTADEEDGKDDDDGDNAPSEQVCVLVAASEVLPVICWSKEAAAARGQHRRRRLTDKKQLKFFLVDGRSEEAASEQGRFPTGVSLSPEAMLDPERLKQNEDMLESLRGAVHIVVMGEGFAALPFLYDHKLTPKLEELMHEDESRTNICALFFVKKGFPFVSVLNGGFAAAHSWLVRNGKSHHLNPSEVLVDYDPEASLFGQLEYHHNASATEKAQRRMQSLLDKSLIAMTRRAQQLERLAVELEKRDDQLPSRNLFGRPEPSALEVESEPPAKSPEKKSFSNPFASVAKSFGSAEAPGGGYGDGNAAPVGSDVTRPFIPLPSAPEAKDDDRPGAAPGSASATTATAQQAASNMFKGLGAAINQSIKNADASGAGGVLKRNPFARFGAGGGAAVAPASSTTAASQATQSGSGGGWNQLRKAAMARMRSTDGPVQENSEEESISFGETSAGSAVGGTASQSSAPSTSIAAQVQQV